MFHVELNNEIRNFTFYLMDGFQHNLWNIKSKKELMQKKSFSTFTVVNIKFKNFWRSNGLIGKIEFVLQSNINCEWLTLGFSWVSASVCSLSCVGGN